MTPERWRSVTLVLRDALALRSNERAAFLASACAGDAQLRREVDSLLAAAEQAGGFLDSPHPVIAGLAPVVSDRDELALMRRLAEQLHGVYDFERELGGGGMSRVFVAYERALHRQVVVKVLSPDLASELSAERFAREVQFAARLQQANIVPVISSGDAGGLPYYTMPFVRGESLRERLASGLAAQPTEALGILKDIARALAHAHGEGVVHRDIKPENVLISGGTAVVTDFGIAKAISAARWTQPSADARIDESITSAGLALGTPAYMAPEQAAGDGTVDPRTDVYAFGVVAYELLAGVHPFAGKRNRAAVMAAHVLEKPRPLADRRPELPPRLSALVMRCLAKSPADRFSSGGELLGALEVMESSVVGAVSTALFDSGAPTGWDADLPSVAVLPLTSLSPNPDTEYFSEGIAEELLSALTRMPGLRVAARTSAFAFKGQQIDLRTVAERLGVKTVLEGSVRRAGTRVRIAVQLVSAADGLSLWSERYDRELADIFAVQEEIALAIAVALQDTLSAGRPSPGVVIGSQGRRPRTAVNPDAFEHYLRGRHLLEQRNEGMLEALRCFEHAIALDPDFSPSHAGISYALMLFGVYHELPPREAFPRARDAAERALALDPTDALALVMRAHCALWHEWDTAAAEGLARRALDLAPGLYLGHDCLGWTLAAQGRFDAAIASMQRARALDPLSEYATYDLAWILILAGRWEEAARELRPALARHPQASELHRAFGFCLFYAGRIAEARAEFERVLELKPGDRWCSTNVVQALAALGEVDEARRLVRQIEQRAAHEPIPPLGIAIMHHWLGDDEAAATWLDRALDARDYWLVMLRFDPSMSRLRESSSFRSLMERVRTGATI